MATFTGKGQRNLSMTVASVRSVTSCHRNLLKTGHRVNPVELVIRIFHSSIRHG